MFRKAKPFFLYVETSLHAGSGSDLGIVDLPIQREKHTDFPKIESSSLKGSIREVFEEILKTEEDKVAIKLVFGPENGDEHAGALGFTDARILLFPVRSMRGVFAWITCPAILNRFYSDFSLCEINGPSIPDGYNKVTNSSDLIVREDKIVLEEYTFTVTKDEKCAQLAKWLSENVFKEENYWKKKMAKDIVILSDDDFRDFVELSTEVIARTKINNETGTVETGALFYEEYLPPETVLYSLALASPIFVADEGKKGNFKSNGDQEKEAEAIIKFFENNLPSIIQIGGNATIGKGIVRAKVYGKEGRS